MPYYKVPANDLPALVDTIERKGERIITVVTLPGHVGVVTEPSVADRLHTRDGGS